MPPGQLVSTAALRAQELLKRIGAAIDPDAEVRSLSMPEQQLVEIACALGAGARILIMDEPTASLTQKEQHLLFSIVRDLRASGVGIIYISHRLEEIFALADRVTVLRDGESVGTHPVDADERSVPDQADGRTRSLSIISIIGAAPLAEMCSPFEVSVVRLPEFTMSDLELRAGEIVGLAGLVGAGRTELARILFGITPADSGEISLERPNLLHPFSSGSGSPRHRVCA